jgi:hypothetical protein
MYSKPELSELSAAIEASSCCWVVVTNPETGEQTRVFTGACANGQNFPTCGQGPLPIGGIVPCVITVGPVTITGQVSPSGG